MDKTTALEFKNTPNEFLAFLHEEEKQLSKFVESKDAVLDVGCGNGRAIPVVAPIVKKYVGIDKDEPCIKEAIQVANNYKNAKVLRTSFEETTNLFEKNSFDKAILLWNTLCLFEKPYLVLKQIGELANGNVFFSMPFRGALQKRLEYYKLLKVEYTIDYQTETIYSELWGKVPSYTKEEIVQIVKNAELQIKKITLFDKFAWIIETQKTNA